MAINKVNSINRMRMVGMSSGLDVDDIVRQLMTAQRMPLDRMLQQRQLLEWKQEEYRNMNSRLREFERAVRDLRLSSSFQPRTVTSSDDSVVSVSTTANQPTGVYTIRVNNLATGVNFASGAAITKADGSAGTLAAQLALADPDAPIELSITNAAANGGQPVTFTFDPHADTINSVVKAINQSSLELQAFYDTNLDRFFLSSKQSGSATAITFNADDSGLLNALQLQNAGSDVALHTEYTGSDASVNLNGADVAFNSNRFTVNGVTYNLHQAAPATLITVQVAADLDEVVGNIKTFVDTYNKLIEDVDAKLLEKRYNDYQPLTETQKEELSEKEIERWQERARSGMLRNDLLMRQALSEMRTALSNRLQGSSSLYDSLAAIGITTGSWTEGGKLHIDDTKLKAALEKDLDAVADIFTKQGATTESSGLTYRLIDTLSKSINRLDSQAGRPQALVDQSYLARQIDEINRKAEAWELRLAAKEERLYRQYAALESFIANMNTQSSWLSQQFNGG